VIEHEPNLNRTGNYIIQTQTQTKPAVQFMVCLKGLWTKPNQTVPTLVECGQCQNPSRVVFWIPGPWS